MSEIQLTAIQRRLIKDAIRTTLQKLEVEWSKVQFDVPEANKIRATIVECHGILNNL